MKNLDNSSDIQKAFMKEHHRHHKIVCFIRILICIVFLAGWELFADLDLIDAFFFSSPSRIIKCAYNMILDLSLFRHIGITLIETFLSFLLVILIGLTAASFLWFSEKCSEIFEPYLVILNSLPKSALAPLFIVWLGTGLKTIIIAGISVAIFGCIISLYSGFKQVDSDKLVLITTLGGTKKQAFFKVVFPSSVPTILSTVKVNIGLSLVGVIIGEFLAAREGLGYLIIYGSQVFKLDLVIMSILILCIIAFLFYKGIQSAEHYMRKNKQYPIL